MSADLLLRSEDVGELEGAEALIQSRIPHRSARDQVPAPADAPHCPGPVQSVPGFREDQPLRASIWHSGREHRMRRASRRAHLPQASDLAEEAGGRRPPRVRAQPEILPTVPVQRQGASSRPR